MFFPPSTELAVSQTGIPSYTTPVVDRASMAPASPATGGTMLNRVCSVFVKLTVVSMLVVTVGTTGCSGGGNRAVGTQEGGADTGSNEAASDAAVTEAASDAASTDAGEFACGDATCGPSQICLYPPYGCILLRLPDAGICPDGWEYDDASGGGCIQSTPPPSCVSLPPGTGSFDCSGQGAGATCGVVNVPVPSGCSRICRAICI